jgi:hypothetical protein
VFLVGCCIFFAVWQPLAYSLSLSGMLPSLPYSSKLDRPQNDHIQLPLRSPPVAFPSPAAPACIWFVVVFNCQLAAALSHDKFCFIHYFAPKFDGQNDTTASSPIVIVLRAIPPNYIPSLRPTFDWLLCPPIQWKPLKSKALLLSLFYFLFPQFAAPNNG